MSRIMVVEDEPSLRVLLQTRLTSAGYSVVSYETGHGALAALSKEQPDLVLLDVMLPGMDGFEICKHILQQHPDIPVVFLTARGEVDDRLAGFEAGARDYIVKPFSAQELLARVRAILREAALRENTQRQLEAISLVALKDPLTQLWNRRYLEIRLPDEIMRCARYERPFSCLLFDVDDFKRINDSFGHETGDEVLGCIATALVDTFRGVDGIVRYGGEEFIALLPETDLEGAMHAAERARARVAQCEVGPRKIRPTVSVGVASGPTKDILTRADRAMYVAKQSGKNRVEGWKPELAGVRE